jgi:hypothetical protein
MSPVSSACFKKDRKECQENSTNHTTKYLLIGKYLQNFLFNTWEGKATPNDFAQVIKRFSLRVACLSHLATMQSNYLNKLLIRNEESGKEMLLWCCQK